MKRKGSAAAAIFALFMLVLQGCGYTTDSLIRSDIRSVYVSYFGNDTWRQGLEVELRRALEDELKLHGGFSVAGRQKADSILEGRLRTYHITSAVRTADDDILMKRITVGVSYRWLDGLSGRELIPWTDMEESVLLAAGHRDAEAEEASREIARVLVQSLERQW